MSLKKLIKRGLTYIIKGVPTINLTAKIVTLSTNELLNDRVALITGGTSGIGLAIAKTFLSSGATVIITGRNDSRVQEKCQELLQGKLFEGRVFGIEMDNSRPEQIQSSFNNILNLIGEKSIDILVNNAGILGGEISNTDEAEFDSVISTNLKGAFFLSKIVARYMKDKHINGNILFIASSSSLRPAASAYTLSKWGIRGLVLGLAKILTPIGIIVNGVAPGPTATPMLINDLSKGIGNPTNPLGRYAMPEEIANMAVFLVSDMGRTIIGDIIYMTGGCGLITFDDIKYEF
jgi:NAD(P)-dependent dehydrogenase (short-subunit alcohol dehydrogenase family)